MCYDVQNYCFEFSKVVRKVLSSLQQHRNVKFAEKEEQGQTARLAAANHRPRKQSRAREFSKDENKVEAIGVSSREKSTRKHKNNRSSDRSKDTRNRETRNSVTRIRDTRTRSTRDIEGARFPRRTSTVSSVGDRSSSRENKTKLTDDRRKSARNFNVEIKFRRG